MAKAKTGKGKRRLREVARPSNLELGFRRDYDASLSQLSLLASSISAICRTLLETNSVPFHSVKSRVKTCVSALEKIERKGYKSQLSEITDAVGVRIVCLYKQHVDPIAELLRDQFEVIEVVDKRPDQDPERFGYSSLHLLCKLSGERKSLVEYTALQHTVFEIQVRTILQEAWAEIEHRLIYKGTKETPAPIRREIARTAAMLETADAAFDEAFKRHTAYQLLLREKDTRGLQREPLNVSSLHELLRREMPWAERWGHGREDAKQRAIGHLLLDLEEQGIADVPALVRLIEKWREPVDAHNKAFYEREAADPNGFGVHGDPDWAHRTKRYLGPVGVVREMLRREFPGFKVKDRGNS